MISENRREAYSRNAQRSSGPRSAGGKSHSRYNAAKHDMTAESTIMLGDDAAGFEARLSRFWRDVAGVRRIHGHPTDRKARQ
jgi:hypothetical protein